MKLKKKIKSNKWLAFANCFFIVLFISFNAFSSTFYKESKYMSLKYNETNVRSGPGKKFPILFRYNLKGMPVIVIGKYDNWYKVKDIKNNIGWVNEHLLSKARSVITLNENNFIYKNKKMINVTPKFKADKNVSFQLIKCNKDICKIKVKKQDCWIRKTDIWGWDESLLN